MSDIQIDKFLSEKIRDCLDSNGELFRGYAAEDLVKLLDSFEAIKLETHQLPTMTECALMSCHVELNPLQEFIFTECPPRS